MVTSEAGLCHGKSVKICWNSNRTFGKMIYFITCFLLLPFQLIKTTLFLPCFPRGKEGNSKLQHWFFNFFSFPMNRLLSYLIREGFTKYSFLASDIQFFSFSEKERKFPYIFKNPFLKYHHLPHPHHPANLSDFFKYPQCCNFNLRKGKETL